MSFTVTCYGKTQTYHDDDLQAVINQYCDNLINSEGNEHNRYMNILCEIFQHKNVISDYEGDILPKAYEHSSEIIKYAEANYYKNHLMKYDELLQYTYEQIDNCYPDLSVPVKNELMEEIVDKAIEISNQVMKDGTIPGGLCRVEEKDIMDGTPTVLFVEKFFIDELVKGDKNHNKQIYDYVKYDYRIEDSIQSFIKDDIMEERA